MKAFKSLQLVVLYLAAICPGALYGQSGQSYDVAAIVWPSYHPDDRAKIFWPDGIGEWQTVMNNKPKFEGHEQPRYPIWGYVNERGLEWVRGLTAEQLQDLFDKSEPKATE